MAQLEKEELNSHGKCGSTSSFFWIGVVWYFLKCCNFQSYFFRVLPLTGTEAWFQTKRQSIISADSYTGLDPSTLETSQVFVPDQIRFHMQGRVNGYIPHIRALTEGGPGMLARGWGQGVLQGNVLSRKCSCALPGVQYCGLSDVQAHFPGAAGQSVGPCTHVTPEAEERHDMERSDVRATIWPNLLYKTHDWSGVVLVSIEKLYR